MDLIVRIIKETLIVDKRKKERKKCDPPRNKIKN